MSLNFKKIVGAGLLSLAVVGGTATYLATTLRPAADTVSTNSVASTQSPSGERHAEITVIELGPAS